VYYSTGGEIRILAYPDYYNPSPNGTTNEWLNTYLSIVVNKTGESNNWDFTFQHNHTTDGRWADVGTLDNIAVPNGSDLSNSISLDGNDYLSAGDTTLNGVTDDSDFTIVTWLKPSSLSSSASNHGTKNVWFARASDSNNDNLEIGIDDATGKIQVYLDENADDNIKSLGGSITAGSWHFVAVRWDSGNIKVWIDGNTYTTTFSGTTMDDASGSPITIGCTAHSDIFFNGLIDDMYAFSTAISDARVAELYNLSNGKYEPSNTSGLQAMWHFDGDYTDSKNSFDLSTSGDPSFSTDTKIQAPVTENITIGMWFSGLDWGETYYWRVSAYNSTLDRYSNSSVYSFTTLHNDTEPSKTYYSQGADIYIEPVYTESEPDKVYYSLGGQISVAILANLSNPYPANGTTGVWLSTPLRIDANKTGNITGLDISFQTNNTQDDSWFDITTLSKDIPPNATIQVWWSGLDWNTTYYWRVKAVNTTTGKTAYSDVYHFTTLHNDTEPSKVYYSQGADIYVEPVYTESEPDIIYYSTGSQIPINRPYATDPIPADGKDGGRYTQFSVLINCINTSDIIDSIEFHWSDGTLFGTVSNVHAGDRASVNVSGLTNYTWYHWYVVINNGNWSVTSDTWSYNPHNNLPTIVETPTNNSNNVAVYRKLVGGSYERFVKITWNMTDGDGDGMSFKLSVQDPSTGTWIQRWTILDYNVTNGSYSHDESLFNETNRYYNWSLWVSDGYNSTTYYYTFYTEFFVDFWWTPEYPTQDDTVQFNMTGENIDAVNWSFGDEYYSTGWYPTHQYDIAGYYNVTLTVFNTTDNKNASLSKTIRIDRNVTMLTPNEGYAGYNWIAWQGNETNASSMADILNLSRGYWIHYYNSSSGEWDGY